MTVDEVREIKEAMSLETADMSVGELHTYYSKGAKEIQRRIEELRGGTDAEMRADTTDKSA